MQKLQIALILGTTREGSMSSKAAKVVQEIGEEFFEIEVTLVDPKDPKYEVSGEHTGTEAYSKLTANSDGFFIVTPEYNHSIPGSLKSLLDAEFGNYKYKPAVIAGVSEGTIGGARAIETLIPILKDFSIWVLNKDVQFPVVNELFDQKGNLLEEKIAEKIRNAYIELIRVAKVLKSARVEWLADK